MKAWISLPLIALVLAGCAGKTAYRDDCANQLDAAWKELDLAKAEGFSGAVSYSKALSLLTAQTCDLVVSDLSMPADAVTLIRRLRELDRAGDHRCPAVALTAHARPDDRRRALEAGFDTYLVKPVEASDLVAVVSRLLRG